MNTNAHRQIWSRPCLLAPIVLIALFTATAARAGGDGDFDYWTKASFVIPIKENWDFKFDQKFSFTDEARRLDDQQQDYGVVYSGLADWLDLGFTFKQKASKEGDDWDRETRPLFNVTVKSTVCGWEMSNRSRIEYRDFEEDDDVWRYRHKIALKTPFTLTALEIQPYVAEEIFVQFDDEDLNGNRVYGGLYIPLHEKIRLELYYAWHLSEEAHSWHDTNLLASYIRFAF